MNNAEKRAVLRGLLSMEYGKTCEGANFSVMTRVPGGFIYHRYSMKDRNDTTNLVFISSGALEREFEKLRDCVD